MTNDTAWFLMGCVHHEAFDVDVPLFWGLHLKRMVCPSCKKVVDFSAKTWVASSGE